ncbi:MAG TPA: asparagine synthase (glutamine-hydrolyzing) [Phycisphaerae bacterium]|nr:asparagine synthase (glutamine-hydrolyzing) [Phycisphaerae bacterium]
MCGITGLIFDHLDPRGAATLTAMTQRLYHRGPDSGGAVVVGLGGKPVIERRLGPPGEPVAWEYLPVQVGLGARRLAIIDPSEAGHQPMSSPDGNAWIVFNGAIYNFRELRAELMTYGMNFRGGSDTEVLLAAYRAWGTACFERLEGMWAVAAYDIPAGRVILSRDRLGIKPLYVARFDEGLSFASEIKALLEVPGVSRAIEQTMLRDFLARGLVDHTDSTLFDGIWAIPPGCTVVLEIRGSQPKAARRGMIERYWTPGAAIARESPTPDGIRESLSAAVGSHLVSDVPVGSCLSGGLDSSTIVSLVHRLAAEDASKTPHWTQNAFTAVLPGSPLDESQFAEAVIHACAGLHWRRTEPTAARLQRDMESLVRHQEQPFGSPSIYMQWEVMRLARETGVTVLLDGQGGDELFCGYEGYIPPYVAHLLAHGKFGRAWREYRGATHEGHFRSTALFGHVVAHLLPPGARDSMRKGRDRRKSDWLSGELFDVEEPTGICEGLGLKDERADPLAESRFQEHLWSILLSESLPALLRYEDRNSMAFSIEARVPLLDRRVVEMAMSIPIQEKIREGRLKAILREAVRDIVPKAIVERRDKIGFSAPTAAWLRGDLHDWWLDMLTSKSFRDRGCFAPKGVVRVIKRFESGDDAAAMPIWRMAIVEQWARQFLDKAPA